MKLNSYFLILILFGTLNISAMEKFNAPKLNSGSPKNSSSYLAPKVGNGDNVLTEALAAFTDERRRKEKKPASEVKSVAPIIAYNKLSRVD